MLRERDYLLTLAAIWLLFAALESSSRSKLVIAASAARAEAAVDNQQTQAGDRATSQMMQVDLFMSKIKKNIDNQQQHSARRVTNQDKRQDRQLNDQLLNHLDVDTIGGHQRRLAGGAPGERENNSYNYYANEAGQQQAATNNNNRQVPGRLHQFKEAHGVRVHFLRTKQDDHRRPHSSVDSPPTELQGNTTNNILYLLNEHSPAASGQSHLPRPLPRPGGNSLDDVARSLEPRADNEPLSPAAQQQPPPFTMFAPGGASANGLADQQQNIRQILANYQRGGVGLPQLTDQQRQLLTQLQPRPPELHLRPPTTPAPALPALAGLLQPQSPPPPPPPAQQQQPFSPLQLLTGPLQAFLPGLGQQPGQQQQQQPAVANVNNQQKPSDGTGQPATVPGAPNGQAPAQFNLLNPFNLPQMQGPTAGGTGQPRPPASGLANLQDFYQQLPLYQALLAARQRQEALQAAQRMRQQQQQQHQANGAYRNPLMPPQQQQQLNPLMPQPPGQSVHNGAGNQNGWTPPAANQQQHPPANRPTSNQAGPVQFDDDQEQQQPPPPPSPQAPVNNNQQQQPQHHENNNNDQSDDSGADQNNNQNNDNSGQNNNNSNDHGGNEQHHQPGPEQGGGGGGKAEEEDPDLKSFQNLANGGDDFAGLFPPGILSNNDINEIKTQQAEQAKKQEQEERQKQQQQQQQQFQQPAAGQQQQQQQQQHDNQPMNQFANGGNQQQQPQSANALNENNNDGAQDDNNQQEQPDDNQEDSEQGNGEGEESPQEGDGDQQQEDAPSAAALTAKSSSSSETTDDDGDDGRRQKFTKSPGVEYATTTTDKTKHKNMKTTK